MSREIVDREHVGRLMHESWSRTKRAQGFHGPDDYCPSCEGDLLCEVRHADLIRWDDLPEKQKDINRHAFDDVLPYFERLLAAEREPMECGHPRACLAGNGRGGINFEVLVCTACAEREKVREMALREVSAAMDAIIRLKEVAQDGRVSVPDTTPKERVRQLHCALNWLQTVIEPIRQLKLTKLDEGSQEKG